MSKTVYLTLSTPTSDVGAGQIRFRLPIVIKVQTTTGQTQFFASCYCLRLSHRE